MKKAFTLLELLVVMGIIGLLGTVSVGGYHAMQRGMEERGVMQNVNAFVRAAFHRAQIDRQPTAVYFWNETLRSSTADEHEIVVGKAVAVRRHGRLSRVQGRLLVDEFADLDCTYEKEGDEGGGQGSGQNLIYLYQMDRLGNSQLNRSRVSARVVDAADVVLFADGSQPQSEGDDGNNMVPAWAFELDDAGGVSWKAGMAYGLEFMRLQLPHNYIFGKGYSSSVQNSVRAAGSLVFDVADGNNGTVEVYSLRADGASLKAEKVADSDSPEEMLK